MKNRITHLMCCLTIGSAALLFAHPARAQADQQDKDFLTKAMQSNVDEIKMAELAERKGDKSVSGFAHVLVDDHTTLGHKVEPYAQKWGLTAPTAMDAEHQKEYDKLEHMSQKEFDKTFIDDMVKDHEDAYDLFHKEIMDTHDNDFRGVVEEGQSMIVAHLNMAKAMQGNM